MENIQQLEDSLLTPAAQVFLRTLHSQLNSRRLELLQLRQLRAEALRNGKPLQFLPETQSIRASAWQVAPCPPDLQNRRVEITGPAEAKMIVNALNSSADVFMVDFEDALSPTWQNLLQGQDALRFAVRRKLELNSNGKVYKLKEKLATLIVRPRGLHLDEPQVQINGLPISGSLFDFGLYFFHNAHELRLRNTGPYFYLPKMESHLEARWWNDVFVLAQQLLDLPQGTIRATCLIETIPAAFEMDEFLFELRDHAAGLNAGRWDYLFSFIKKHHHLASCVFPDRAQVTMTIPMMRSYCELLVQTCHRRGAHAIGGMSAFIPNRNEPEITANALKQVQADKKREANLGFDGTWIAHPDLADVARAEFAQVIGEKPHQKTVIPKGTVTAAQLLDCQIEGGTLTEKGIRANINVALLYIDRWLAGLGAAALHNLMEDAATAEISRSQLWQWVHHQSRLQTGLNFSAELYSTWQAEEAQKICHGKENLCADFAAVTGLLEKLVLPNEFADFLTTTAFANLRLRHHSPRQGGAQ